MYGTYNKVKLIYNLVLYKEEVYNVNKYIYRYILI